MDIRIEWSFPIPISLTDTFAVNTCPDSSLNFVFLIFCTNDVTMTINKIVKDVVHVVICVPLHGIIPICNGVFVQALMDVSQQVINWNSVVCPYISRGHSHLSKG